MELAAIKEVASSRSVNINLDLANKPMATDKPKRRFSMGRMKKRNSKSGDRMFSPRPSLVAEEHKAKGPRIVVLSPGGASHEGSVPAAGVSYCPIVSLDVKTEIHLAMAFVRMTGTWRRNASNADDSPDTAFVFELPTTHKTSVTSATVSLDNGVVFDTVIVEATPALGNYRQREGRGMAKAMRMYRERCGRSVSEYDPELFALPFHGSAWSKAEITIDFLLPTEYRSSGFEVTVPTTLQPESLTRSIGETLAVSSKISSGTQFVRWKCDSHPMKEVESSVGEKMFTSIFTKVKKYSKRLGQMSGSLEYSDVGDGDVSLQTKFVKLNKDLVGSSNRDVVIRYAPLLSDSLSKNKIMCTALYNSRGGKGTMSTFIMPPNVKQAGAKSHPRNVVFLLDRSGSMGFTGVMDAANEALCVALEQLQPHDSFAICAYDHRQYWFAASQHLINSQNSMAPPTSPQGTRSQLDVHVYEGPPSCPTGSNAMAPATKKNIKIAKQWVRKIEPGGLTDILSPIQQSMVILGTNGEGESSDGSIPMIFLLTDGAVENERQICKYVTARAAGTRFFTFGIGTCCNAYFLRLLASIGRGYCDVSLTPEGLKEQIVDLFRHASEPVLVDINLKIPNSLKLSDLKFCPYAIPDLYRGGPVVCSVKFTGKISPKQRPYVIVEGKMPRALGGEVLWTERVELCHAPKIPLRKVFAKQQLEQLIASAWLEDEKSSQGKKYRREAVALATEESIPSPFTQMVAYETNVDDHHFNRDKDNFDAEKYKHGVIFVGAAVAGAVAFGSIAATLANIATSGGELAEVGAECECCELCECLDCV